MKVANFNLKLNKLGSTVPLFEVTPAEAQLLTSVHHANAGESPLKDRSEVKEVQRTDQEEIKRLLGKYQTKMVRAMYPGASPNLPKDFETAEKVGVDFEVPTSKMLVESGGKMPEESIKK